MRIATKNTVATALAVALAGMGLPAAALAANAADEAAGSAATAADEDVLILSEDNGSGDNRYSFMHEMKLADVTGKWFQLTSNFVTDADFETLKYMIKVNEKGDLDFYVDGTGNAGAFFPVPDCCDEYAEAHGCNGTLYIGAGITSIGAADGTYYNEYAKNVRFAEGSQLKKIGSYTFGYEIESVNLEECRQLESISQGAFDGAKCDIIVPASVREADGNPFTNVVGEIIVEDPENTPVTPTGVVMEAPRVTVAGNNKVKVTWEKPHLSTYADGKLSKTPVDYAVRYRVEYTERYDWHWEETALTSSTSTTLTALAKGLRYDVTVTAYKKSGSKWEEVATSRRSTTAKVKGYDPAPKVKAGKGSLSVTWSKVPGATRYEVLYAKGESAKWKVASAGKATSATVSGLAPKKEYQVKVRAHKGKTAICESPAKTVTVK